MQIGPQSKAAVGKLIEVLDDHEVRPFATTALGRIGQEANAAVPRLIELLKDANAETRRCPCGFPQAHRAGQGHAASFHRRIDR